MTVPVLKIKVLPKAIVKGKMDVRFPGFVTVTSPILLDKTGGNFTFSLDINALLTDFTGLIPPSALAAQAATTVLANNTGSVASPTAVTYPAFSDNLFGSSTQGTIATRSATQWSAVGPGSSSQPLVSGGAGSNVAFGNASAVYSVYTNTGTGAASRTVSSRLLEVKNVFDYGAVGNGTTDDTTAIQNAINAAQNVSTQSNRGHGKVYAPPGFVFKTTAGLLINQPIEVEIASPIEYAATTGAALTINSTAPTTYGSEQATLRFAGFKQTSSGNSATPGSVNAAGATAIRINYLNFSRLEVGAIQGFTNIGVHLDGSGGVYAPQVIQHNNFWFGQIVNCGYGIYVNSLNAATSSAQACYLLLDNVYQCFTCIRMDNTASDSFTFEAVSIDNCNAAGYGIQCFGKWNVFRVGYTAAPIRFESGSAHNVAYVGNTIATGASFVDVDGYATSANKYFSGGVDWAAQVGAFVRLDQFLPPTNPISFNNMSLNFIRQMQMTGSSSGVITFNTQAAAGTYNWNWPITAGTAGDVSLSGGGGSNPNTWQTPGNLTKTDDTNVTLTLGGTPTAALLKAASITAGWTGTLSVARGGTGDSGTAWTTYTPTVGSGSGTITTASATGRYKQIGKTTFIEMAITITTNGTGATFVTATLPGGMSVVADTFFGGKARAVSGKLVGAAVQATGSTLAIANYDNTYPGANGEVIVISGVFEAT